VDGFVGNFRTVLELGSEGGKETVDLQHGAIVLATGAMAFRPDEYMYGKNERIMLQSQMEKRLAQGKYTPSDGDNIVMIQCVGSRNEEHPYCSSICCGMAVKNALKIKEMNSSANVYILYRDMNTYGFSEEYYSRARDMGVVFVRFDRNNRPEVEEYKGGLKLTVRDPLLGTPVSIRTDFLVLSTAIVPNIDGAMEKILSVPRSSDRYYLESHVQLKPVDSYIDGIFICGMAHFPKPVDESIAQAKAAASKAVVLLSKGFVKAEPIVSTCDIETCTGCGLCENFCPYGAIAITKMSMGKRAEIVKAACKGCGVCASYCPVKAISMGRFTDRQICAQIDAFGEKEVKMGAEHE
jgi:heterodisulfide reductase subunit A